VGKVFNSAELIDHLRLRYGRRWKFKVRLVLVQGTDDHIEKVVPGLKRDHWQENNGIVLIHAGQAKATPEPEFVDVLYEVRPQRPVDGIVQVMDCAQLPDAAALDTLVRSRQKGDSLFGWQAPVWLWFIRESLEQEGEAISATGSLFGPGLHRKRRLNH
jgi:type VI secretion system protein ImpL